MRRVAPFCGSCIWRRRGLQGFPNHTHFDLDDPRVWEWDGCLVAMLVEAEKS